MVTITDQYVKGDTQTFTVDEQQPFSIQFTTEDGFRYAIDHGRVSVAFHHRMRAKSVSAGPPTMELITKPRPYTTILSEVCAKTIEAAMLLAGEDARTVNRVGIVASTSLAEEDLPPGIARLVGYVGRPWKNKLDHYNINIVSDLESSDGFKDRCIHYLIKPEDKEKLLTVQFDWQRTLEKPFIATKDSLTQAFDRARKDALGYFEDLAVGSRFDEDVIRAT